MLICCLYIFFDEMSGSFFGSFFNWTSWFFFKLLNLKRCIFKITILYQIYYLLQIFSPRLWFALFLLTPFFTEMFKEVQLVNYFSHGFLLCGSVLKVITNVCVVFLICS